MMLITPFYPCADAYPHNSATKLLLFFQLCKQFALFLQKISVFAFLCAQNTHNFDL